VGKPDSMEPGVLFRRREAQKSIQGPVIDQVLVERQQGLGPELVGLCHGILESLALRKEKTLFVAFM